MSTYVECLQSVLFTVSRYTLIFTTMKDSNSKAIAGHVSSNNRPSICLITALTVADFIDPELTAEAHSNTGAQLGVLTLAALLRQQGYHPHIINLDDLFFEFVRHDKSRPSINAKVPKGNKAPATEVQPGHGVSGLFFPFVAKHLPIQSFGGFWVEFDLQLVPTHIAVG